MIGFLARECGWDINFILDKLTMGQLIAYYEIIQKQKFKDLQYTTIAMLKAVGYARGSVKKKDFMQFIEDLECKKTDSNEQFDKAKRIGLPIEDK